MTTETDIQSIKQKIDAINREAWETRVNDSTRSLRKSQESLELAKSINYRKGIADGLRNIGFCNIRLAKNDEAVPLLNEAFSIYEAIDDLSGQALVYEYLGIVHRNKGDFGGSLELLFKALALTENTPLDENHATHYYQLGVTYKHLGDFETALEYFYRAMTVCRTINNSLYEAYCINLIGSIYFENGNYLKALDYFLQGLPMRQAGGDKWGEAGSLDNIGFTYLKLNELDKAIDYCKQSLAISQGTGDKKGEANALLHLAEIYEQAGDVKRASKFSNQSLEIRKARGDKRGEAEVLLFLADLHKKRGDIQDQQIFDWISGAAKIADEIKAQDLLSKAYYNLHEYHGQKGNYKESLAQLEAHLQIEKELHKNTISQKVSNLEISHKAETISQRNKELTELNEQIEKANSELKIESSLERVRTAAMAMNRPDDMLEVCKIISHELALLEVKEIRNIQTAIFYEEKGSYMNYEYYAKHDKQLITEVLYTNHPVAEKFANQMLKGANEVFIHGFKGQEVRDWLNYQKTTNVFIDTFLESAGSLNYYWYSLGPVALGISTYAPLNEEEIELFKRFRNVFELAYRRYLDIEKALAQAREAQIEAALEKVRSNTMAMRSSEDLASVATVMFDQMRNLGGDLFSFGIVLCDKHENMVEQWHGIPHAGMLAPFFVPVDLDHIHRYRYDQWKAGVELFSVVIPEDYIAQHFALMLELPSVKAVWAGIAARGIPLPPIPGWEIDYGASFKYGYLLVSALKPFKEQKIFSRFANVFEQAYTRFLDLQKAEAQAREAQIETALERIRARAMAMHSSNELIEVANILREQMGLLGQSELETCVVNLYDVETGLIHNWNAFRQPGLTSGPIKTSASSFPGNASELTREMVSMYQSGKKEFTLTASGSKLAEFFDLLVKSDPQVANYTGRYIPEKVFYHFTAFTGGSLLTVSYQPPNDDIKLLQRRAASVFDMAYRRYLDLKKAEANARESQIETSLERVRSKTMGMHKSEEVTGIAVSLNEELLKLGFEGGSSIIIINKETGDTEQWTGFSEDKSLKSCYVPYFKHPCHDALLNAWKKGEQFLVYTLTGEEKKSFDDHYFSTGYKIFPENDKRWMRQMKSVTFSHAFMKYGAIHWGPNHLTEEQLLILQRFSKVFEQSYTRFLDLQKAEAQAREAQIEAALERVRSRTMGMQRSDELPEAANLLFRQIESLGIHVFSTGYNIWQEDKKMVTSWMSSQGLIQRPFNLPLTVEPALIECYEAATRGDAFYVQELSGDKLISHLSYMRTLPGVDELMGQMSLAGIPLPHRMINHHAFFLQGYLLFITYDPVPEAHEIFRRFAKVFEQTFTRFLDLQKAEAQAREAQIEAALERVRSRSMAMHKSDELLEVVASVFHQMQLLGFNLNLCNIVLFDNKTLGADYWASGITQAVLPEGYHVPYADHPFYHYQLTTWRNAEPLAVFELSGEIKKSWDEILFTKTDLQRLPDSTKKMMQQLDSVIISSVATKHGLVQAIGSEQLSTDDAAILSRFAKVFEQTYTRFLDLQKAEAQAREAQIEAALEKVRSRSLAMHKSDELKDVIHSVFERLNDLNFELDTAIIIIFNPDSNDTVWWLENRKDQQHLGVTVKYSDISYFRNLFEAKKNGKEVISNFYNLEEKNKLLSYLFDHTDFRYTPEAQKEFLLHQACANMSVAIAKNTAIHITRYAKQSFSETQHNILKKFSMVFDQAYTRFLDLQKAELQAREAQIEAALERVRAKVMAMTNSKDLNETSLVFGEQLRKLGIDWQFSYFWLIEEEKNENTFWITWPDNKTSITIYTLEEAEQYFNECLISWRAGIKIHDNYVPPQDVQAWLDTFQRITDDAGGVAKQIMTSQTFTQGVFYYDAMMKYGSFGICINQPATDEEKNIQCRFAIEFERAYTRFLDLKRAEAQAREANIEVALERVRARALAMQQPEELKEVAQVLRNEMGALGVEELETSSIYIHGESSENVECWYALKDPTHSEKKMVSDHFILNLNDTWVGREMKKFYSSGGKQTSIVMQGVNRKEWIDYCYNRSPAFSGFYGETIPDRTYHLYKFSHGYIGAAAPGDISAESWKLLSRAASVFSLAYSRFKDLTQARHDLIKLKEEKKRAEDALTELQHTQKQLIQTEKMASLGELTAGIAHEIQNPLNFVNNFSDVSNELLEEMKIELEKGNAKDAMTLANNVKENLEKILHHGKRADAIVKGMLQHSRNSSGQKELTDINELADEYLRLAYHGLRAKDKFFNAKFETDLDPSVDKVNIVPQEIGRVILNLINNSFYAVSEKKKNAGNGYDPVVIVSTRRVKPSSGASGVVEISVKDNGNGIPEKVLDKIFQPFFTTKPTGQGTGLGLSLSYDIVTKGHGGDIKVETIDGMGSEFIISLPVI